MKTILMIAAGVISLSCSNAQKAKEGDVPSAVKEAFAAKFPGAKADKWIKETDGYEVEFVINKVESSADFDMSGKFKEMEQEIEISELPNSIKDYCKSTYAGYKIAEVSKITEASGNIKFEAEMNKGAEKFDAIFDSQGNFLEKIQMHPKKEKDSEEEDDEANVPENVKAAFAAKFPGAKAEGWDKEEDGYEVEFEENEVESSAVFSENGTFKEMEQEIKTSELPKGISEYCSKNFAGYKLSEAAKITDVSGIINYEAEMSKGDEKFDAIFDVNANFIKKIQNEDDDKKDNDEDDED